LLAKLTMAFTKLLNSMVYLAFHRTARAPPRVFA
jgi:hypothetical protein